MNYILTEKEMSYADMKNPGRIVIDRDDNGRVVCLVSGFEFQEAESCRIHATKAMAWGRDVLDAAVRADVLVPGGHIVAALD